MGTHFKLTAAFTILALLCNVGCADWHYTRHVDVTSDKRFQLGYKAGQTWEARTIVYLMEYKSAETTDNSVKSVWSSAQYQEWIRPPTSCDSTQPAAMSAFDFKPFARCLATLPVGATIHIDRLEYPYDVWPFYEFSLLDPRSPGSFRAVSGYSTVTCGNQKWVNVTAPCSRQIQPWFVDKTIVWHPAFDLVKLLGSSTKSDTSGG